MIASRLLFRITLAVGRLHDLGDTPRGRRRVAEVTGGRFEGDRLRGTVVPTPAGDWLLQRHDDVTELDVRLLLRTDDGALIDMRYGGLRHGPADAMARLAAGEVVDPSLYYFRTTPRFETAAPAYLWLNKVVSIGIGSREPTGPVYEIHEVL
ncbi:MAG: DUF3237 domain-containing protein [Rubrivivax sp.]